MMYHVKALPIERLRALADWPGDDYADDTVVFIHPDASVRLDSTPGSDTVVWSGESATIRATIRALCGEVLAFEPPPPR